MRRLQWLTVPLVLSFVLVGVGQQAVATRPALVDEAISRLLAFRTVYITAGDDLVVQVDAAYPIVTVDAEEGRIHWDGDKLWFNKANVPIPVEAPPEWSARVAETWTEYRAGFPNTSFVEERPDVIDPDAQIAKGEHWFRVELPFEWDDDYIIYAAAGGTGFPCYVSVYDASTGQPVEVAGHRIRSLGLICISSFGRDTDVPLSPATYSPIQAVPRPRGQWGPYSNNQHGPTHIPTWHEAQQYVKLVPWATNGTSGGRAGPKLTVQCSTAQEVHVEELDIGFTFPPERAELALDATADCPEVKFEMGVEGHHMPAAGQRSCIIGAWQVVNTNPDPDQVLWQHSVDQCRNGPEDAFLKFPTELPVPAGADVTGLEVRLRGEIRIVCRQPTQARGHVSLQIPAENYPRLSWPGCYPGWDPAAPP